MSKISNKLQRLGSLLSASDPDAVERCGAQEKFGVWVQAVPLVITPLFGFIGAAYAAHDIQTARAGGAALSAPALVLVPAAVGLVYACLLFAIDWKIARSLDVDLGGKRKAALIVPRLLLAAFTAFLISVPLKAFLFEDEIRKFLLDEKQGRKAAATEASSVRLGASKEPLATAAANVARLSDRLRGVPDAPQYLEAKAAIETLDPLLEGLTRRTLALQQGAEQLERQIEALGQETPEYAAMQGRISAARAAWNDRRAERSAVAARLSAAHAQATRAELDWRSGLGRELSAAEKERSDYSRTHQELLRADQAERSRVSAEIDGAYRRTSFAGKVVALTRLAAESGIHTVLMLGVYLLFLLFDLAPALVKLMSKRDEYHTALAAVSFERTELINQASNSREALHQRVVDFKRKAAEQGMENLENELAAIGSALGPAKARQLGQRALLLLEELR